MAAVLQACSSLSESAAVERVKPAQTVQVSAKQKSGVQHPGRPGVRPAAPGKAASTGQKNPPSLLISWRIQAVTEDDTGGENAHDYYRQGLNQYGKGNYGQAIINFSQAVALDPEFAAAYSGRGSAYYKQGDLAGALADFTCAVTLDPNYTAAYYSRGSLYKDKHNNDMAIADFTQVIKLDPENAEAYYRRGTAYKEIGDFSLAVADFTQAKELLTQKFKRPGV
jgi:tetratricopeptide (TPR) repeat protein